MRGGLYDTVTTVVAGSRCPTGSSNSVGNENVECRLREIEKSECPLRAGLGVALNDQTAHPVQNRTYGRAPAEGGRAVSFSFGCQARFASDPQTCRVCWTSPADPSPLGYGSIQVELGKPSRLSSAADLRSRRLGQPEARWSFSRFAYRVAV